MAGYDNYPEPIRRAKIALDEATADRELREKMMLSAAEHYDGGRYGNQRELNRAARQYRGAMKRQEFTWNQYDKALEAHYVELEAAGE